MKRRIPLQRPPKVIQEKTSFSARNTFEKNFSLWLEIGNQDGEICLERSEPIF
jgi:hypothetical protein